MNRKVPQKKLKRRFFMSKITLASGENRTTLPERVDILRASKEAGRFLYKIVYYLQCLSFAFKWLKVQLSSLICNWILWIDAFFSTSLTAYNVSLVKSTTYNKNRQQKGCHTIPLQIGLFIALFCGKSGPEDSESHLTHLKLNSYIALATCFLVAFFVPINAYADYPTQGKASYYTRESCLKESGQCTMANGKELNDENFTCASWDYPFKTVLLITNKTNGKGVYVVVSDRGPNRTLYNKGRKIDLSYAAMRKLDGIKSGVIPITIEVIK